jgi:hypothetical protein
MNDVEIRRETALAVVALLFAASDFSLEEVEAFYQENGLHHDLLELVDPEAGDSENPDYAASLDEFEGELLAALENVNERRQSRD